MSEDGTPERHALGITLTGVDPKVLAIIAGLPTVQKATKKPVEIEFMHWQGGAAAATPIIDWILGHGGTARYHEGRTIPASWPLPEEVVPEQIRIDTLEGAMTASVGDIIIRGVQGEFYPCKPDIFADTYDWEERS